MSWNVPHRADSKIFQSHLFIFPSSQITHQPLETITMAPQSRPFDLSKCARPNILKLHPYRCAREYVAKSSDPAPMAGKLTFFIGAVTTKTTGRISSSTLMRMPTDLVCYSTKMGISRVRRQEMAVLRRRLICWD
jgi:hypothetical protein